VAHQPKPATLAAYQTLRATKIADIDATFGAQIGVNLFLPNGKLASLSDFGSSAGGTVSASVTDEVDEGQYNLYFTAKRAQDAVGGILTDTATIDFTYNQTSHVITADLKTLTDAGGGALIKIARDQYGRVSGTSAATTDDLSEGSHNRYFSNTLVNGALVQGQGISVTLTSDGRTSISLANAEGGNDLTDWSGSKLTEWNGEQLTDWSLAPSTVDSFAGRIGDVVPTAGDYTTDQVTETSTPTNLWFTPTRVRNVVLTGLSLITNAAITSADSLLMALGKLQAQITARQVIGSPVKMPNYTLATLPAASSNQDALVVCTDTSNGRRVVWSDGTNWLRLDTNTVAS
jgi:hypothetical protein